MLSLMLRPVKMCDGLKILQTLLDVAEPELQMAAAYPLYRIRRTVNTARTH
jgi:hypothetical protein